ncbi:protein phosphatase CheZ [Oceanisphaera psychrotolerans]|uniref:Protein phosphatase CheZ n=1 Tax=Oceanisphaera psychrotolerans TaxID=1414654 RepID=A0A1J4QDM8_9GAMM|nr:protein phosphatase CheZ [Oceanisphaera psychrotolerans]OIN07698.1 protein phosphatase [Oceanisphaera psychrotolerans]
MAQQKGMITLEQARQLVAMLESGDQSGADHYLTDVCMPQAKELVEQVGQLTRQLHDALQEFRNDPRLPELAESEIPDARERLSYVIDMTDKAANRTMDAVETCLPIADRLNERIQQVMPGWRELMQRQLELDKFKTLCFQLDDFLQGSEQDADQLRQLLTEILMAQDYQDLTGQMIRRVINLVHEVEAKLVAILSVFGRLPGMEDPSGEPPRAPASGIAAEGPIINKEHRHDVVSDQDGVDDLLSSLGF